MFFFFARPEEVVHSLQTPDGKRVGVVRDETYQTALRATKKAIREDNRTPEKSVERDKQPA